jgi:hypothetical protein
MDEFKGIKKRKTARKRVRTVQNSEDFVREDG